MIKIKLISVESGLRINIIVEMINQIVEIPSGNSIPGMKMSDLMAVKACLLPVTSPVPVPNLPTSTNLPHLRNFVIYFEV